MRKIASTSLAVIGLLLVFEALFGIPIYILVFDGSADWAIADLPIGLAGIALMHTGLQMRDRRPQRRE